MIELTNNKYATGIFAGLASALLMLGAERVVLLSLVFLIGSVSVIIIIGLRSGVVASILAIMVAALSISLLKASPASFIGVMLMLAPSGVMAYLASFARPADEVGGSSGSLLWYPLADILFYTSVAVALSTVMILAMIPDLDALYGAVFTQTKLLLKEIAPNLVIDPATEGQFKSAIPVVFPFGQSLELMMRTFAAFYFAVRLSAAFGLSQRPREDIPQSLRMTQNATFLLLAGIVMMFVSGLIARVGASLTGAVVGGFILSGYAVLHFHARGKSWKLPGLILAYLSTAFLSVPVALFFLVGLANPHTYNPPKQ